MHCSICERLGKKCTYCTMKFLEKELDEARTENNRLQNEINRLEEECKRSVSQRKNVEGALRILREETDELHGVLLSHLRPGLRVHALAMDEARLLKDETLRANVIHLCERTDEFENGMAKECEFCYTEEPGEKKMTRADQMVEDVRNTENNEVRMRKALSYISNITTMAGEWNMATFGDRMALIRNISEVAQNPKH